MRTVTFRSVLEAIERRHALDPKGDAVLSDAGLSMAERINARVKRGWYYWAEAPDLTLCEERAFRQIWNNSRQFWIRGENNKPDEVFYIPDMSYYSVRADAPMDPPVGTAPTDTAYWETLDPVEQYIAYDQICKKPIGDVLGVYGGNPATVSCPRPLCHRPSGRGIEVRGGGLPTVFVRYVMPPERFTTLPYIASKTYHQGELVYVSDIGECYQALTTSQGKDPQTEVSYWRQVLFPEFLEGYVKAGVYADTLRESDSSGERDPVMLQIRGQNAQIADAEAEDEMIRQINRWQAQGQHYFYIPFKNPPIAGAWYSTPAYTPQNGNGSSTPPVTTLTDECECGGGYFPPPLPTPVYLGPEYHPEIVSLTGPATPTLAALSTTAKPLGFLVDIILTISGSRQSQRWELRTGAGDPADPGHVAPLDYNATTNNKHWERVG